MADSKEAKLSYGFDFSSPLFSYLGGFGDSEVIHCGKKKIGEVDLGLDPREVEASGYRKIEENAEDENRGY